MTVQPPAPPPVTVTVAPSSVTVAPGATQLFTASVTGSANTAVTWSVNGTVGGSAAAGFISAAGVYTAPATPPNPATVTIRATSVASASSGANASVSIVGPPNPGTGQGTSNLSAARFLEQASFGPTPADLAHVKQVGIDAWLAEQFNTSETPIIDPGSMNSGALQAQYLSRLSQAPDQLRQRVAYALSQIIVISMNKNIYPDEIVPYLQILSKNAFGNYRTLLGDISVSSQMGKYLDLAHSMKPSAGGGANENYARELMQLFTIGLYNLNPDGSQQLDPQGHPISTYDQTAIQQVALALTGWTYKNNAWEDFSGPLVPLEANHDTRQKAFLGCTLPANQTTTQDMNSLLDCLFNHPNIGPFISTRLIRSLVTSNPTPGLHPACRGGLQRQRRGRARRSEGGRQGHPHRRRSAQRHAASDRGPAEGSDLPHRLVYASAGWKYHSDQRSAVVVLADGASAANASVGVQLLLADVPHSENAAGRSGISNLHADRIRAARELPLGDDFESRHGLHVRHFALRRGRRKHAAVDRRGRSGAALWTHAAADAPKPGERNRGAVRQRQPRPYGALPDGAVRFVCSPILRRRKYK